MKLNKAESARVKAGGHTLANGQPDPGPWIIKPDGIWSAPIDGRTWRICVLCSQSRPGGAESNNGPLIASAPALLAALEALISHDSKGRFGAPDWPKAVERGRAALALAKEGKTTQTT